MKFNRKGDCPVLLKGEVINRPWPKVTFASLVVHLFYPLGCTSKDILHQREER